MPSALVPTRLALHRVAEHVISPLRVQATANEIALTPRPGGFGTPELPNGGHVAVDTEGVLLVPAAGPPRRAGVSAMRRAVLLAMLVVLSAAPQASASPPATTAAHAGLSTHRSAYGTILSDGRGHTLYAFTADPKGRSTCSAGCARAWPPLLTRGAPRAGRGVRKRLLGTTRRADGHRQVTYNGRPLYYFSETAPGQVLCQAADEFGGLWLILRASGRLVR